jgi:hypothetical protein
MSSSSKKKNFPKESSHKNVPEHGIIKQMPGDQWLARYEGE